MGKGHEIAGIDDERSYTPIVPFYRVAEAGGFRAGFFVLYLRRAGVPAFLEGVSFETTCVAL